MTSADLLIDAFGRIKDLVHSTVKDRPTDDLTYRPTPGANSIAWLVWHLTRIQDDHVAGVAGHEQAWTADGWYERFGLPFDPADHGYGHSSDDVAAVVCDAGLLTGYHDAVHEQTLAFVKTVEDADLDRIVDRNWDPPVTLGVRLVSVVSDDLQHIGQAAYLAGLLKPR